MKKTFSLGKLALTAFICTSMLSCDNKPSVQADYNVIPLPQKVQAKENQDFIIKSSTKIAYPTGNDKLAKTAQFLSDYIKETTGMTVATTDKQEASNAIVLKNGLSNENKEAYQLSVTSSKVTIDGASDAAVFFGVQTLRKAFPIDAKDSNILLPGAEINDYPRFAYRGMMLDVGRHMFPVEFIKEYIDILALHNINTFHWHLTEDQGWRIEIKKYPELTEVGSIRKETVDGHNYAKPRKFDGKPYGGFYTQEEIKDIVKYADERFITIIPEIDLPGHMLGALKAYPELGCTGGPYEVATHWGVFKDVLCVGNEKTFEFLENVLTEVVELFPSHYIHIGGDECPKDRWQKCPKCQAKIRELGLKKDKKHSAEEKLQSYCISRVEKFLNGKGRQIIGWDEILEGGLAPNATVMSWRSTEGGIAAAKQGNNAIMVPYKFLYFDYQQGDEATEPLSIGGYLPVEKVYSYEPIEGELTKEEAKHVIGLQANLWTEYIPTTDHVEYMVLPRMDALSEIQWVNPEKKDYKDFLKRLDKMRQLYDRYGYNYAKHVFEAK